LRAAWAMFTSRRYFQMDLLRRAARRAIGVARGGMIDVDRQLRVHRFREVARIASRSSMRKTALIDAMSKESTPVSLLRGRPFEYWYCAPSEAWTAEDVVLCVHAMYLQLQDAEDIFSCSADCCGRRCRSAGAILESARRNGSRIDGSLAAEPRVPLVSEAICAPCRLPVLRGRGAQAFESVGSNMAVAGSRTKMAARFIANDMHLGFRVPTFGIARLIQTGADNVSMKPGDPAERRRLSPEQRLGRLGLHNSYGEFARSCAWCRFPDVRRLSDRARPDIDYVDEPIEVGGAPTSICESRRRPGPVVGKDGGSPVCSELDAHDRMRQSAVLELEQPWSRGALSRGARRHSWQNMLVADKAGHIGWTIAGRLPRRVGTWAACRSCPPMPRWASRLVAEASQPRVVDPPEDCCVGQCARHRGAPAI